MAERHQLKIADRNGIAEDDPFAELTRIMGFDPREPVKPQAVAVRQPGRAEPQGEFDIDLEKELLGEFATYDELAQAAAPVEEEFPAQMSRSIPEPVEDHAPLGAEIDDAVTAALEQDASAFDDDRLEISAADPQALPTETEAPAEEFEIHADALDDAGGHHAVIEEAGDAEVAAALRGTWFGPAQDEAVAEDMPGLAPEEAGTVVPQPFDDHGFDAAVSLDLGDEFSAADEIDAGSADVAEDAGAVMHQEARSYENPAADEPAASFDEIAFEEQPTEEQAASYEYQAAAYAHDEAAPYEEPLDNEQPEALDAPRHPEQATAADMDDFDAHFDSAMADVDMDFTARVEPVVSAMSYGYPGHDDAAQEATQAPAAVSAEPEIDSDVAAAFDDAFAHEAVVEPSALAEPLPEPASARRESTLEDELNALLAKMTTRPAVAATPAWPLTTPVARRESAPAMPVSQPAPPVERAPVGIAEDELHAALMADLHAMDLGDTSPQDDEIDFDAEAFQAALADADDDRHAPSQGAPASNWAEPGYTPAHAGAARPAPRYAEAPELDTVEVPERVVALAEDLDIPDVPFEEAGAGSKFYDDLDSEFADLLGKIDAAPEPTHAAYDDDAYGAGFNRGSMQSRPAATVASQQPAATTPMPVYTAQNLDAADLPGSGRDPFTVDELAYDPDDTLEPSDPAEAAAGRRQPRRGVLIAGIVCAVAVAGGLGALAMSFGGKGGSEAPALVKADDSPIKVKPENPGGTVIPNQNNKVYEAVAKGIKPAAPEQQKLITSNEEPVDVNAAAPQSRVVDLSAQAAASQPAAGAPAGKSEDRVEQTAQADPAATEAPVVTPRKVRTMVVKPDGSLVPREDPAPAVAASEPADPAPQHVVATGDQTGAVPPAKGDAEEVAKAADEPALKPAREIAATPKTAPIAPQRPSDQPLDVVGEVKPDQVASIGNAAPAAGSWSMQIASQPTAESAQTTYQDLARRYGGVLGGHGVNIVKADIAGKGTFYRVRVPAQSRNDAIKLCESYKAAGGNCFVSK